MWREKELSVGDIFEVLGKDKITFIVNSLNHYLIDYIIENFATIISGNISVYISGDKRRITWSIRMGIKGVKSKIKIVSWLPLFIILITFTSSRINFISSVWI